MNYRAASTDSEALIVNTARTRCFGCSTTRPKHAIHTLAAPITKGPFGLVQRPPRPLCDYLDAKPIYELPPAPHGRTAGATGRRVWSPDRIPFGSGRKRTISSPSWTDKKGSLAGDSKSISYRPNWGHDPPGASFYTLLKFSRNTCRTCRRCRRKTADDPPKFLSVDFEGCNFSGTKMPRTVVSQCKQCRRPRLQDKCCSSIDGHDHMWRLVLEVVAETMQMVELRGQSGRGDPPA